MNKAKTKVIFIDRKSYSTDKLNSESELLLGKTKFVLLGITFSDDLSKMIKCNFSKYITQIEDIIKLLNKCYLTHLGQSTDVTPYVISKFIHLFNALPNPDEVILKKIET